MHVKSIIGYGAEPSVVDVEKAEQLCSYKKHMKVRFLESVLYRLGYAKY